MNGVKKIVHERFRQIQSKGYTLEHDAEHNAGSLVEAAVRYAIYATYQTHGLIPVEAELGAPWPWEYESWKPSDDPVRNLVKAGALIAAEIDRLTVEE